MEAESTSSANLDIAYLLALIDPRACGCDDESASGMLQRATLLSLISQLRRGVSEESGRKVSGAMDR